MSCPAGWEMMIESNERPPIFVHLLPSLIPPGALHGGVAVVVDVLRATSVMVQALASGCEGVVPCAEVDEAIRIRDSLPAGTALLAGERLGLPIEGFDFGNSPGSFTPETCQGKTLVMTTTNGTRAILASLEADAVFIAAFSNLMETSARLREVPSEVHIVCSGTNGLISFEDAILAGALACDIQFSRRIGLPNRQFGNDEAEIAARLWATVPLGEHHLDQDDLAAVLSLGRGGKRVREIGLAGDIRDAARVDRFPLLAALQRDPLRVVRFA
jgi:2-phosphosulfolactate phosphatase